MNRNDKLIVALLFLALMGWLWYSSNQTTRKAQEQAAAAHATAALSTNAAATTALTPVVSNAAPVVATNVPPPATLPPIVHSAPEETNLLHSDDMDLLVSSRGATLLAATLHNYTARPEKNSGHVILDFHPHPALALSGVPGLSADADYRVAKESDGALVFTCRTPQGLRVERTVALGARHLIRVIDRFVNVSDAPVALGTNWVTLGTFYRGSSKNDELSVDSFACGADDTVRHWSKELPGLFGGGGFGCLGPSRPMLDQASQTATGSQHWVALKSRFFVQALMPAPFHAVTAFRVDATRDANSSAFALSHIDGAVAFPAAQLEKGQTLERSYQLYIGPKKLAYLTDFGGRLNEIMEFNAYSWNTFFGWFCRPLVQLLNFSYAHLYPNYGVAIILLTILVRLVFWPLTHKSTESAKRMRDVQPKIKALQEQFKDEPQKMQQEIWAVYRAHKVNPLSSCLPMLVQLPVFIALYTVLRSAVELRFAPFLWVADLSEPENLLAGILPISLNILPLVMAAVTIWQSKLTPAMGDPTQQKMMTWMMPLMMLFFFYSMPAALSLYWTVSTLLAILQLWLQQRTPKTEAALAAAEPEKLTRQQRRRLER